MSDALESPAVPLKVDGIIVGTAAITERGELISNITSKETWLYFKELMHASELSSVNINLEYRSDECEPRTSQARFMWLQLKGNRYGH